MPRTHLTDLSIKALKPTGKQVTHWDENLAGFGVRVSQKGTKTFVVMVGKERKLISLGRYPHLSLKTARTEAQKHFNAPNYIPCHNHRERGLQQLS